MSSNSWSDTSSTTATSSRRSTKKEARKVADVVNKERSKDSITIAVVREDALERVERACIYDLGFFEREAPPTQFTTAKDLQDTIEAIKLSSKQVKLNLLISPEILRIYFEVPSHFNQLKVLRCAKHRDRRQVLIEGSATYNNVRLDKWQAREHRHHTLIIGHERGVRIEVNGIVNLPEWARCRSDFSELEKAELGRHFETLSRKSSWDEGKGIVAAIVGIAVGTTKLSASFSGTAGGLYAKYTMGLHAVELGLGGAKFAAVATAAGSAVVLGVAAGAAVYFIPWGSLFDWLKGAFSYLWDKICALWDRFKEWVVSLFTSSRSSDNSNYGAPPKPMSFSEW